MADLRLNTSHNLSKSKQYVSQKSDLSDEENFPIDTEEFSEEIDPHYRAYIEQKVENWAQDSIEEFFYLRLKLRSDKTEFLATLNKKQSILQQHLEKSHTKFLKNYLDSEIDTKQEENLKNQGKNQQFIEHEKDFNKFIQQLKGQRLSESDGSIKGQSQELSILQAQINSPLGDSWSTELLISQDDSKLIKTKNPIRI